MVNHFTKKINDLNKKHTAMYLDLVSLEGQLKKYNYANRRTSVNKNTASIKETKFYKPKKMEGKITLRFKEKTETFDASFFPKQID